MSVQHAPADNSMATNEEGNSIDGTGAEATVSTSTSLLAQVKDKHPAAWQRFVDIYGPLVYQWCRQSRVAVEDAADVVQDVFVAVAEHIHDFRRDRPGDSLRGWLWTITRNKLRDHFRRLKRQVAARGGTDAQQMLASIPDHPPDSTTTPSGPVLDNRVERRALDLVRAGVEDRTWWAFWGLTVDARSAADLAEELDMNARTVYEAKYRVLRRLRQELDGLEGPATG
jgi:RNA polymerase sigma-70 factor (ECF subfamily)